MLPKYLHNKFSVIFIAIGKDELILYLFTLHSLSSGILQPLPPYPSLQWHWPFKHAPCLHSRPVVYRQSSGIINTNQFGGNKFTLCGRSSHPKKVHKSFCLMKCWQVDFKYFIPTINLTTSHTISQIYYILLLIFFISRHLCLERFRRDWQKVNSIFIILQGVFNN